MTFQEKLKTIIGKRVVMQIDPYGMSQILIDERFGEPDEKSEVVYLVVEAEDDFLIIKKMVPGATTVILPYSSIAGITFKHDLNEMQQKS